MSFEIFGLIHLLPFHRLWGEDSRDAARASPGNDMVGTASCAEELGVRWRYVDFDTIVQIKCVLDAVFIKSFFRCLSHERLVRGRHGVECLHGDA